METYTYIGVLYDYRSEAKGSTDIYRSLHQSLFEFTPQRNNPCGGAMRGATGNAEGTPRRTLERVDDNSKTCCRGNAGALLSNGLPRQAAGTQDGEQETVDDSAFSIAGEAEKPPLALTYAGRVFDRCRMCGACTKELRATIVSSGHDLELWHTVDHERRALLTGQRWKDMFKARWVERERGDRQVNARPGYVPLVRSATLVWGAT